VRQVGQLPRITAWCKVNKTLNSIMPFQYCIPCSASHVTEVIQPSYGHHLYQYFFPPDRKCKKKRRTKVSYALKVWLSKHRFSWNSQVLNSSTCRSTPNFTQLDRNVTVIQLTFMKLQLAWQTAQKKRLSCKSDCLVTDGLTWSPRMVLRVFPL